MFSGFTRVASYRLACLSAAEAGRIIAIASLFAGFLPAPVVMAEEEVENIRSWASPERTRLVFDLSESVRYSHFSLKNPERLVVDIHDSRLAVPPPAITNNNSLLKKIRYGTHKKGNEKYLRMVLDLKSTVRPEVFLLEPYKFYGYRLVVDMYGDVPTPPVAAAPSPATKVPAAKSKTKVVNKDAFAPSPPLGSKKPSARPSAPARAALKKKPKMIATPEPVKPERKPLRRDIIVAIDAGHGGEDPGAIGSNGTQEKHVALQMAKRLSQRIDSEKGMRSFLVRTGDYFIKLQNRVKKARANKADLLISIHADAFTDRSVQGASVFVLSRKKATSKRARLLADRENASDLIGGVNLSDKDDVVALVLVELSQSAALDASVNAARYVVDELDDVGKVHKRRIEAAGFLVLSAPDVPSILVETGYISNPQEEKNLKNPAYQKKMASALFGGIKSYFEARPPPNTLFAYLKEKKEKSGGFLTQN